MPGLLPRCARFCLIYAAASNLAIPSRFAPELKSQSFPPLFNKEENIEVVLM